MNVIKRLILTSVSIIVINSLSGVSLNANQVKREVIYKEQIIALDAGHYYKETYKCSPDKYLEVKYNLAISKLVKKYIETDRPFVKVVETNPNGTNIERSGRGTFAKNNKADLLISLHMDSLGGGWQNSTYSTHAIVDNQASKYTQNLALSIINGYSKSTGIPLARGNGLDIRGDGANQISMLDTATRLKVPAILIEMSFMDHKVYGKKFRDAEYQKKIARALADSIITNYIDNTKKVLKVIETPIKTVEKEVIPKEVKKDIVVDTAIGSKVSEEENRDTESNMSKTETIDCGVEEKEIADIKYWLAGNGENTVSSKIDEHIKTQDEAIKSLDEARKQLGELLSN